MTGVISTPPIGATNFRVKARGGSVGITSKGHSPLFKLTLGYQVRMIRNKNPRVSPDSKKPNEKLIVGKAFNTNGVTKFKASTHTS